MAIFVIHCCVVSLTSISYAVRNSAGKGYVTCVENFQISCFSGHVGFWLSRLTFTAGPYLSIFSFALENFWSPLFLTTLDSWQSLPSSLTISAVRWHQLCASHFEFCCQLYFLWIKCFRIPGSPEYKRINYVSTQQHLSLKLGIVYLASA